MKTKPVFSLLVFCAVAFAPTPTQAVSRDDASDAGSCIDQGRERVRSDAGGVVYPFAPVGYRFVE